MKCSFCGEEVPKGQGKIFARNDGRVFYFCKPKCERNFKLGRDAKAVKWTKTYSDLKGK